MPVTYETWLVLLSIVMAIQGAYVGLSLAVQIGAAAGMRRRLLLAGAAFSLAIAIWTMHFVGMLAARTSFPIDYLVFPTLLSFLVCVVVVGAAVYAASSGPLTLLRLTLSACLMGGGIFAMHYIGMSALSASAYMIHDRYYVAASMAIAIAASGLALWLATGRGGRPPLILSAITLGVAVSGMHYTAMAGLTLLPYPGAAAGAPALSTDLLAIIVVIVAFCVSGIFLLILSLQAEAVAKQAERELRLAINTIPALVWTALPDGSVDFINQRWEEIGLSLDDVREWNKVLHPVDRMGDRWRVAVETGTSFENIERLRRADGEYRWFLGRAQPLRDELGKIVKWYGVSTDIEDQKRAEDALRESEQRFRDYTESAFDWYWETGPDHRFINVSDQLSPLGMPVRRIGLMRWELARDVEEEPEKWRRHMADLDAHKPFRDFRYRATNSIDGSEVYIATSGKPLFDPQGRFLGYRGVGSDITAAVRAAQLEEALQEAKVVGDNIAHDLRTPLSRVRIRLERGREHASTLEELRAVADQAIAGLDQSLTTVTALLRITEIEHRRRREGFGEVQLAPLIREVGDLYDPIAEDKGVALWVEAPDGATVRGDRDLLFEAVTNLVDNAVKFTPEGGRVELALLHQEGETVIRVSDTGPGIPEIEREAVTQRFYRSDKSRNTKGLGLGLSMVAAIVKLHGFRFTLAAGPGCMAEIGCLSH
ncbi:MAG TPA: MHYT domain-containing protein [Xanthobacteraceae bacterium]|nr:MHYT domain-containing protein [Xanthobacteraceae bacterium]